MTQASGTARKLDRRRIKAHKKSRAGCKNCKFRKIKCDESRPSCAKCRDFGVRCDYTSTTKDLQLSVEKVVSISVHAAPGVEDLTLNMINAQLRSRPHHHMKTSEVLQLDANDLAALNIFQSFTVLTVGTATAGRLYRSVMVRLACEQPFLMHMILGMTALHNRALKMIPSSEKSPAEAYHLFKAVALFNEKINTGVYPEDRDALWATAVLLGASMYTSCETTCPEDSWPLKPPSATDLDWLRFTDGKKAIWKITEPLRPDGAFSALADQLQRDYLPHSTVSDAVFNTLPPGLIALCDIYTQSTPSGTINPYRSTLHALAPLLQIDCGVSTILKYLSFISHFDPHFRHLLFTKDTFALLILAHWFAKVCRYEWWIANRAMVECRAICIYLERHCAGHGVVQDCVRDLRRTYGIT